MNKVYLLRNSIWPTCLRRSSVNEARKLAGSPGFAMHMLEIEKNQFIIYQKVRQCILMESIHRSVEILLTSSLRTMMFEGAPHISFKSSSIVRPFSETRQTKTYEPFSAPLLL